MYNWREISNIDNQEEYRNGKIRMVTLFSTNENVLQGSSPTIKFITRYEKSFCAYCSSESCYS